MKYTEIKIKTALHKLRKGRLPYSYDLNIYRGCFHRCQYCYAIYSHRYIGARRDFFNEVMVKSNVAENLEKELSSKKWKKDIINLGGVCDSYQPVEAKYKLMRQVLKVMIKYENPIIISTKSDLILRDIDLLEELAGKTYVGVGVTITTADEDIRKMIEPYANAVKSRFNILHRFSKTKIKTGLHVMPVLPYLTDSRRNLEELFSQGQEAGVDYVLTGLLNLRSDTKKHYFNFIKNQFPGLYDSYLNLYQGWQLRQDYKEGLYKIVKELKYKYGLGSNYMKSVRDKLMRAGQGRLF